MSQKHSQPLIGESPPFRHLLRTLALVGPTDANVVLVGEAGTGKHTLARALHRRSRRPRDAFHRLACTGLPQGTSVAEAFQQAGGGTLFLDEVGELPEPEQARLIHLLEREGPARPRILSSTRFDLWERVQEGQFRRDLYDRLFVVPLALPPLRERVQDIGPLTAHFFDHLARRYRSTPPRFDAQAERQLRRYTWPGNVRELRNLCERLVILFPGKPLGPENLPQAIRQGVPVQKERFPFRLPETGIDLGDWEREMIRQALVLAGGNKSRAARLLGLTRDTLLYRIRKYLIQT